MKTQFSSVFLLCLMLAAPALSQDETVDERELLEAQRKEAFVNGMSGVVASLNAGSLQRFMDAIDQEDFQKRIYGLRLIDTKLRSQFAENFDSSFEQIIKSAFDDFDKNGVDAVLIGVDSRGTRGRAVVRFNLPKMQFNYHEYDLRLNEDEELVIVDWRDYLKGEEFTEHVGLALVSALPSNQAARKLIDFQNVSNAQLFEFREALKAARDMRLNRYLDIFNKMDPELKRQRVLVLKNVQFAKLINDRRMLRQALELMNDFYATEPLFTLMLLDYWFPTRAYEDAHAGLARTYEQLDFPDAGMEARLSAAVLVLEQVDAANAHADRAIELESGLELGWWSALRARSAKNDYAGAVEALGKLEQDFGHDLGPEAFAKDPSFAPLLQSSEYQAWLGTR